MDENGFHDQKYYLSKEKKFKKFLTDGALSAI